MPGAIHSRPECIILQPAGIIFNHYSSNSPQIELTDLVKFMIILSCNMQPVYCIMIRFMNASCASCVRMDIYLVLLFFFSASTWSALGTSI